MSARIAIVKQLASLLKEQFVSGSQVYSTNLYGNVESRLKFWDEVNDYPTACISSGGESREYHPGGFKWGFVSVNIKIYVNAENSEDQLESILTDLELFIDNNQEVEYASGKKTTEILINSILTDEGLLAPLGVGDISLMVRYQIV